MRVTKLTLKNYFMAVVEAIFLTVVTMFDAIVAVAIFAAITDAIVMSGVWIASLFK